MKKSKPKQIQAPKVVTKVKPTSKKSQMITLLERPEGVTIAELENAVGWQPHSVRGALVHLKNKDKLPVTNTMTDGTRYYRIVKQEA
jgi:predicted ArsR family transcriptional regulator